MCLCITLSIAQSEKYADDTEDCDLGRRLNEEDCRKHHCTWQPGHKTATCWGPRGRLEDCGATDEQSCRAIPRYVPCSRTAPSSVSVVLTSVAPLVWVIPSPAVSGIRGLCGSTRRACVIGKSRCRSDEWHALEDTEQQQQRQHTRTRKYIYKKPNVIHTMLR
jgi:hypothetical protein